ncbi:unnamed protein product [Laminaria digitata]
MCSVLRALWILFWGSENQGKHVSICLSVCRHVMSACLPARLSACLYVCLHVCYIGLSVFLQSVIGLSVCTVCLSVMPDWTVCLQCRTGFCIYVLSACLLGICLLCLPFETLIGASCETVCAAATGLRAPRSGSCVCWQKLALNLLFRVPDLIISTACKLAPEPRGQS